jgi:hypothetical protein
MYSWHVGKTAPAITLACSGGKTLTALVSYQASDQELAQLLRFATAGALRQIAKERGSGLD